MVPRLAPALAGALLLAGCIGSTPGIHGGTPTPIEPKFVGGRSTGGQCVESPPVGLHVESATEDGVHPVTDAGNVTIPGAHYVLDETNLTRVGEERFRLDVNTTEATAKAPHDCPNGGIVHYEVTLQLPATDGVELERYHDGTRVAGLGSGGES